MRSGAGVPPAIAGATPAGIRGQNARCTADETPAPQNGSAEAYGAIKP